MYKLALRGAASRATLTPRSSSSLRSLGAGAKRFASSGHGGRRTWKSGAARWVTAGAAVYWYTTSDYFKEDSEAAIQRTADSLIRIQESDSPTIDAIVEEKRARAAERVAEDQKRLREAESAAATQDGETPAEEGEAEGEAGMGGLEEEADQQGAFNPETGEINWECPCLGGMAHGPCGPEFREAFSCFVYSKEEPKGVECIEKFKGMQDCFRQHPEMYGSELEDDEDEVEEEIRAQQGAKDGESTPAPAKETESIPEAATEAIPQSTEPKKAVEESHRESWATTSEEATKAGDEGGDLLPKAVYDAISK